MSAPGWSSPTNWDNGTFPTSPPNAPSGKLDYEDWWISTGQYMAYSISFGSPAASYLQYIGWVATPVFNPPTAPSSPPGTPTPIGAPTQPEPDTEPSPGTIGGDNRVLWGFESPAYTWATSGLEFKLKHLKGGELWVDKVYGTVNIDVWYREDADPCWRKWFSTSVCAARDCTEVDPVCAYPDGVAFREGYRYPVVFPEPHPACDSMGVRPSTVGYQFQVKIMLRGWCRVRGLILYAMPHTEPQYHGIAQPPEMGVISGGVNTTGMTKLPNPFA